MDARSCRCPGRFFAEAEVALVALILLSRCTALPTTTEPAENSLQQRAEALADSSACHQLGNREALQSILSRLHDSSSSVAGMQRSAGHSSAFRQGEQERTSQCRTAAPAGHGTCTSLSGEASLSEPAGASRRQDRQTSRSERCMQEPACRRGSFKHREEHIALPLPELRRQVGIRWPQQDLPVTLNTGPAR